jgi:hypothetical protein
VRYQEDQKNEELFKDMQREFYRARLTEEEFKEYEQSEQ